MNMNVKKNENELSFLKRLLVRLVNQKRVKKSETLLKDVEDTLRIRINYLRRGKIDAEEK